MTQRKYPTLAEFEELKEAVEKLSAGKRADDKGTVYVPAAETSAGLGVTDANGVPVTIGSWIQYLGYDGKRPTSPAERVYKMQIEETVPGSGKATVCVYAGSPNGRFGDGCKPCVNGKLRNFAVVEVSAPAKKTTA